MSCPLQSPAILSYLADEAVEFDMKLDPELGDGNNNHVSVHTKYEDQNSASELAATGNATVSCMTSRLLCNDTPDTARSVGSFSVKSSYQ